MMNLSPCDKHLDRDNPPCIAIRREDGTVAPPQEVWAEIRRLEREVARLALKADEVFGLRVESGCVRMGG